MDAQRFIFLVDQLEESKRFLLRNSLSSFRLALILLDNVVELIMCEEVAEDFYISNINTLYSDTFPQSGRQRLMREQEMLRKYFDQKIKYLVKRDLLDSSTASAIKSLHSYRNSAFHLGLLSEKTIKPAAHALFEIACELLIDQDFEPGPFPPGVEYEVFTGKYRVEKGHSFRFKVYTDLISGMDLELVQLRKELKQHVDARIEGMTVKLRHIQNAIVRIQKNETEWLSIARSAIQAINKRIPVVDLGKASFKGQSTSMNFGKLRKGAEKLLGCATKQELFDIFSKTHDELEILESQINEAYSTMIHSPQWKRSHVKTVDQSEPKW